MLEVGTEKWIFYFFNPTIVCYNIKNSLYLCLICAARHADCLGGVALHTSTHTE